jgi:hypothetical protein
MQNSVSDIDIGEYNLPQFPGDVDEDSEKFREPFFAFPLYKEVVGDDAHDGAADESGNDMEGIENS